MLPGWERASPGRRRARGAAGRVRRAAPAPGARWPLGYGKGQSGGGRDIFRAGQEMCFSRSIKSRYCKKKKKKNYLSARLDANGRDNNNKESLALPPTRPERRGAGQRQRRESLAGLAGDGSHGEARDPRRCLRTGQSLCLQVRSSRRRLRGFAEVTPPVPSSAAELGNFSQLNFSSS